MQRNDLLTVQLGQLMTRKVKNNKLKITLSEDYWYSSKISVFAIPNPDSEEGGLDIVVSPFLPLTWKYLYALKIVPHDVKDAPGFITKLSNIFMSYSMNILKLQSNPTFSFEPYSFWVLLDLSKCDFIEEIDISLSNGDSTTIYEDHYKERSKRVRAFLENALASLVKLSEVRGVEFLYNFVRKMEQEHDAYWHEVANTESIGFEIEDYEGEIPEYVLRLCNLNLSEIQYSIISNPNQKTYFIIRLFVDVPLVYLNIQHKDEIGSIFRISEVISSLNGNVLSATALIEKVLTDKSHYFVLISVPSNNLKKMLIKLVELSNVHKVIVSNYSEHHRGVELSSLKSFSKIEITKKNPFMQKIAESYRIFRKRNYFSLDVAIRVFFEKLFEIIIFTGLVTIIV